PAARPFPAATCHGKRRSSRTARLWRSASWPTRPSSPCTFALPMVVSLRDTDSVQGVAQGTQTVERGGGEAARRNARDSQSVARGQAEAPKVAAYRARARRE